MPAAELWHYYRLSGEPMKQLFAVNITHGAAWQVSEAMGKRENWTAHASLMNAFEREGFIVVGGPLEGTSDVLLIVRA